MGLLRDAITATYAATGLAPREWVDPDSVNWPTFDLVLERLREEKAGAALVTKLSPLCELGLFSPVSGELSFESFINSRICLNLKDLPYRRTQVGARGDHHYSIAWLCTARRSASSPDENDCLRRSTSRQKLPEASNTGPRRPSLRCRCRRRHTVSRRHSRNNGRKSCNPAFSYEQSGRSSPVYREADVRKHEWKRSQRHAQGAWQAKTLSGAIFEHSLQRGTA